MRFKEINDQLHPPQPAAAAAPEPEPAIAAPSAVAGGKKQPTVPNNSAENVGLAPGPQVLGTISDKDLKKGAAAAPAAATAKEIPKDPKAAYDAAYALYQSNDFAESGSAFKAFLAKYPEHQLAPSATYWVGESSYAQKDYKAALVTFAEGYKKFPNSTKAPDLLYKMGQSFAQVGMTKEACSSYKRLFDVHTDMPERLRKAATADKAKLGC
jgi:tol-pal system protein YbgF